MENSLDFLNKNSRNFLENEAKRDRACTYIFHGKKGSNHLNVALHFIYRILYKESNEYKEHFYKNFHLIVNILESGDNSIIKKEDMKKMVDSSFYSSFSNKKFFIVNSIENMKEDSWSTLLKILEEPINSIFILISYNSIIPSTILSRSLSVDLSPNLEKIKDIELFKFLDCNLEDYLIFKKENLSLSNLKILPIEDALKNYIHDKSIKVKSILIKSVKEFYKNIEVYNKFDRVLLAEKFENIAAKDKSLIYLLFSLIIDECLELESCNIDLLIFFKNSIGKNVNISLILINFFINLS